MAEKTDEQIRAYRRAWAKRYREEKREHLNKRTVLARGTEHYAMFIGKTPYPKLCKMYGIRYEKKKKN